jgi:invasion protein IalB
MVQQEQDNRIHQPVPALELSAPAGNKVEGVLVLPFGLLFDPGVNLLIDNQPLRSILRYRTLLASLREL